MSEYKQFDHSCGICPLCGGVNLTYGRLESDILGPPQQVSFWFACRGCGAEGEEWYNLEYATSEINTEAPEYAIAVENVRQMKVKETMTAGQRRRMARAKGESKR
jgi:hypothetical protein